MSALTDIYDQEGTLETALYTVLTAAGLVCVTPDNQDFQKERPRVEIIAMLQGAQGRPFIESCIQPAIGQLRETAWKMQVKLEVITDATSLADHREYRAKTRNRMAKICPALNAEAVLPNYDVHSCKDAGATPAYKGEDGYYRSTLLYDLDVQVNTTVASWATLTT